MYRPTIPDPSFHDYQYNIGQYQNTAPWNTRPHLVGPGSLESERNSEAEKKLEKRVSAVEVRTEDLEVKTKALEVKIQELEARRAQSEADETTSEGAWGDAVGGSSEEADVVHEDSAVLIATVKDDKVAEKLEDIKVSLAPLLKLLECPVCLEPVRVPFVQCKEGHLVCEECKNAMLNCPTCRSLFSAEKQVCIRNLLMELPRPCRHSCGDVSPPSNGHELFCRLRPVKCRWCKEFVPVSQMMQHSSGRAHPETKPLLAKRSRLSIENFMSSGAYSVSFFLFDNFFWLGFNTNAGAELVQADFEGLFAEPPAHEYFVTLRFEKGGVGPSVALRASETGRSDCDGGESSTKIFLGAVKRCVDQNGRLDIGYELYRKTKPKAQLRRIMNNAA